VVVGIVTVQDSLDLSPNY